MVFVAVKTQIVTWVKTPCSRVDTKISEEHAASIFYPVDGGSMFLRLRTIFKTTQCPNPENHHLKR
jgi:hypothetical protein